MEQNTTRRICENWETGEFFRTEQEIMQYLLSKFPPPSEKYKSSTGDENLTAVELFFRRVNYDEFVVFPLDVEEGVVNDDRFGVFESKTYYEDHIKKLKLASLIASSLRPGTSPADVLMLGGEEPYGVAAVEDRDAPVPIGKFDEKKQEFLGRLAVLAIKRFNMNNNTSYRCVTILDARVTYEHSATYYLKFTAADTSTITTGAGHVSGHQPVIFVAKVKGAGDSPDANNRLVFFCCPVGPVES